MPYNYKDVRRDKELRSGSGRSVPSGEATFEERSKLKKVEQYIRHKKKALDARQKESL